MYPGPGSNRYSEELVFETSASTNSATWASVWVCKYRIKIYPCKKIISIFIKIICPSPAVLLVKA